MSRSEEFLSRTFRWRRLPLALLALLALPAPLLAHFPVQEVSTSIVAQNRRASHPRRIRQLIEVQRDLPGEKNSVLLRYWRTSERHQDMGRLVIKVQVLRDMDGDGTPEVYQGVTFKADVRGGSLERSFGLLPPLRAGDVIHVSFSLRRMPRIPPHESAFAEAILMEDLR